MISQIENTIAMYYWIVVMEGFLMIIIGYAMQAVSF